jgi:hypothetical protein
MKAKMQAGVRIVGGLWGLVLAGAALGNPTVCDDALPPDGCAYVSQNGADVTYGTNAVRYLILGGFSHRARPLDVGLVQTQRFKAVASFACATNGPVNFAPLDLPVCVELRSETVSTSATETVVRQEITTLDATCASNLAALGILIRESPTLSSVGTARVIRTTGGSWQVDSFFDVFTELSTDGGASWMPATTVMPVELVGDPNSLPPHVDPSDWHTPPIEHLSGAMRWPYIYSGPAFTAVVSAVRIRFTTNNLPPPPWLGTRVDTLMGQAIFALSTNGGASSVWYQADAFAQVGLRTLNGPGGDVRVDTELYQLFLHSGMLPPDVTIRESPILPSRGGTTLSPLPDGTWKAQSFFDVFTEISLDGGADWTPSAEAGRVTLESPAAPVSLTTSDFPNANALLLSPADEVIRYGTNAALRNFLAVGLGPAGSLPPPDSNDVLNFTGTIILDLSTNGDAAFSPRNGPANCAVQINSRADLDTGGTRLFDTELLGMDISGGGMPPGVMIRESPTRRSPGANSSTMLSPGNWRVDSFFDIWTELSVDGGGTWLPGDRPMSMRMTRNGDPSRISRGIDLHATPSGGSSFLDFGGTPIPPGFFDPGSDPFTGRVPLLGAPIAPGNYGPTDTIVERKRHAFPPPGGSDTVPIEIVALNLYCAQNISVTYGGSNTQKWYFQVCLSSLVPQSTGSLTIARDRCPDGGSFESYLPVRAEAHLHPRHRQRRAGAGPRPGVPLLRPRLLVGHQPPDARPRHRGGQHLRGPRLQRLHPGPRTSAGNDQ